MAPSSGDTHFSVTLAPPLNRPRLFSDASSKLTRFFSVRTPGLFKSCLPYQKSTPADPSWALGRQASLHATACSSLCPCLLCRLLALTSQWLSLPLRGRPSSFQAHSLGSRFPRLPVGYLPCPNPTPRPSSSLDSAPLVPSRGPVLPGLPHHQLAPSLP